MRRPLGHSFVAAVLALVIFGTSVSFACGPFEMEAIFTYTVHPNFPLERFARGDIGVIQPSYARSYLYVAYRQLNGLGFDDQEQKALTRLWRERLDLNGDSSAGGGVSQWLAARQKVVGVGEAPKIEVYRHREKPDEYETYLNCQNDAFLNAATTLTERITKYGVDSSSIKDWVGAQDQVFANCSDGNHIPPFAQTSTDSLFQADRTYQTAAANFYSGNFDEAKRIFDSIAADGDSPWQKVAPYLIARTLVRKASLGAAEVKNDSLSAAEKQLRAVLADRKLVDSHSAATRLLDVVRFRLHPEERLHELSQSLLVKNQGEALKQALWDYTLLLDNFLGGGDSELKTKPGEEVRGDDLTDWIASLELSTDQETEHSLLKWTTTHSNAWLIAAMSKVDGKHPKAAELISEGMKIKVGSAAFPSARFHVARLLLEAGKPGAARLLIDDLLQNSGSHFDKSSLNLLIRERLALATSLDEFLTFAPRIPAGLSWNDDGREIPSEASEMSEDSRPLQGEKLFDIDAAHFINQQLPLALLQEAAKSTALPARLRRDVVQATWIRAVLLGDYKTADELAPTLKNMVPELSTYMDDFVSQTEPNAKTFSAIYIWLKFPGLEPIVDSGIGRQTPLGAQDPYRDNWWCSAALAPVPDGSTEEDKAKPKPLTSTSKAPAFLTVAQRAAGAREYSALKALGAGPDYLCRQAIQWVTKNPTDPRAPETLHLAVNSTRYGCTDKATGRWSKGAYDLLHRNYPNSTWAKKTKYWFKD